MINRCSFVDGDAASNLLERRWFGAQAAARTMQAECDSLREVMVQAETAWRRARLKLAELENLRDALGDELVILDGQRREDPTHGARRRPIMTAA